MPAGSKPASRIRNALVAVLASVRQWPLFWAMVVSVCSSFLVIGADSFSSSSRAILHGLCAQRPSHSFSVGSELLPFDARMTGIYTGSFCSLVYFLARKRVLSAGTPPLSVIIVLATAVASLAIDGFNALFVDIGLWHPYEPQNAMRFFTGFGTGVAIATLQVWLIGGALWKLASTRRSWQRVPELWWTLPVSGIAFLVITIAPSWLYAVLASLLMLSAWITVTGLVLVIVVSILRIEARIGTVSRLELPMIMSALAALAVIIGLAQFRFWLERTLGIPQDVVAMSGVIPVAILR